MTAATTTKTQRRLRLEALRAELLERYRQEEKPVGRIEEIAREIADIQSVEFEGRQS